MPPFLKYMSAYCIACGKLRLKRFIVSFANHWAGSWISSSRGDSKPQIAPNGQAGSSQGSAAGGESKRNLKVFR